VSDRGERPIEIGKQYFGILDPSYAPGKLRIDYVVETERRPGQPIELRTRPSYALGTETST
jgi:hypothetical protein